MEEKKGPSKAEILKMAIDGLNSEDKKEFTELIAKDVPPAIKNKLELQVG